MGEIEYITIQDFQELLYNKLDDFYWEKKTIGNEIAFEATLGEEYYVLRILTSIPEDQNYSRGWGEDSIKLHIFDTGEDKFIESATKTKRTEGWKNRITQKIRQLIYCPQCSERLYINYGQYGGYKNCSNCDFTSSINTDKQSKS